MNKKLLISSLSLALVLVILVWLMVRRDGGAPQKTSAAMTRTGQLPVTAYVAKVIPVDDILVASGTVLPDEMVELSSEVSGRIASINFIDGQIVRKGDLLVSLNNADLQAQKLRNRYQLELAEERERRQKLLLENEGISQQTYDQTLTELNSLKAEKQLIEAQLEKTMIRAPFDGITGLRSLSEGAYVSAGTKIVKLVRSKPVKIDFSVPERYAPHIRKGALVRFRIEGSDRTYEARITATEAMVDQRSRSLVARATYANTAGEISPGMFARVELSANGLMEALQIPARAVIPEMGNSKVFIYRQGKAQPSLIEPGLRTTSMIQVLSGLNENDTVITSGLLQLRSGMSVQLKSIDQP